MDTKSRTGSRNSEIAALAARQYGVVSRGQLRVLGLSDEAITVRARSGYLHPLFRGTYAVGHPRVGRAGRLLAAVLACGDGTVLSHGSAAELLGLWDKRPLAVDVISRRCAGREIDGIRRHNVPRPEPDEIETRQGLPCTTASRALVDMAGRLSEKSLRRMVEQAAVLRVLDIAEVDRILARGRRRGAPILRAALATWRSEDGGTPRLRSLLEARFLPPLAEAGLPRPRCNVKLAIDGECFEVDLLWPERRLVIETDGEATHGTQGAFHEHPRRDQVLGAAGYRTARVTWAQLENEPKAVVARVRSMLEDA